MSKISKHQIPCPACGHTGEFTRWDSINVDLAPDMREKAKNGAIFTWTCPHCGKTFTVPYATLYHDMKRKLMIYYMPSRPKDGKGLTISPPGRHYGFDGYINRCTYEIEDFMEKIAELESGLDDNVIEFLKYVFSGKSRPADVPEDAVLRFVSLVHDKDDRPTTLLFRCITREKVEPGKEKVMMVPYDIYEEMEKDGIAPRAFEQEAEFPEVSQTFLKSLLGR